MTPAPTISLQMIMRRRIVPDTLRLVLRVLVCALVLLAGLSHVDAQQRRGLEIRGGLGDDPNALLNLPPEPGRSAPQQPGQPDTATRPPAPGGGKLDTPGQLTLGALVTDEGQRIDQGLFWLVFQVRGNRDGTSKLVAESHDAAPTLKLSPGVYAIVVGYGQANATRRVTVQPGAQSTETFVVNAGGLRLNAMLAPGESAPPGLVTFNVLSDERDQMGERTRILQNARPGVVYRLNSGLYQIVSQLGDANARVTADITVEPGKLTEAAVTHAVSRVTLKLVTRQGGEAQADTQWTIYDPQGNVVKESAGALPTHLLAPGSYTIMARSGGRTFRRNVVLRRGETAQVEVLMQ